MTSAGSVLVRVVLAGVAVVALTIGVASPASAADEVVTVVSGSPDNARDLTPYNGKLYLSGQNGSVTALYQFDGTAFSLVPGAPADARNLFLLGDRLYFQANTNAGPHLFSFDGATATDLGQQVFFGPLVVTDTAAYFQQFFGTLLRFDGASFTPLAGAPANISEAVEFDGDFFVANTNPNPALAGLHRQDGGSFTTVFTGTVQSPYVFDGQLYFTALDGVGWTLYRYDGVAAPVEVVDLPAGANSMIAYDGALHLELSAMDFAQLVRLEGTELVPIAENKPNMLGFEVVGAQLYFSAFDDLSYGTSSAYVVSGTTVEPFFAPSYYARDFQEFAGAVYFTSSGSVDMGPTYVHRIGAVPALAATGLDLRGPGAVALLLAALGAWLLVRRNRAVGARS